MSLKVGSLLVLFALISIIFGTRVSAEVPQRVKDGIQAKETGGKSDPDNEVGDKKLPNHAYGRYQFRQPIVDVINNHFGTNYKAEQCLGNPELSEFLLEKEMEIYATFEYLGHEPQEEDMFCLHNGGTAGPFKNGALDKTGRKPKTKKVLRKILTIQAKAHKYASEAKGHADRIAEARAKANEGK